MPPTPTAVLVVTSLIDETANTVIRALIEREARVVRVDPADIGTALTFSAHIGNGRDSWGGRLLTPSRDVSLEEIGATYYRRPSPWRSDAADEQVRQFVITEARHGLRGDQFQRGTNLKAWLFTILHNTFRNMRRHDGRNPVDVDSEVVEQAVDTVGAQQTPEQLLTRATLDADLQAALDDLPVPFRQAVWLRDVEEFTYAEIAEMIGVPIGTVMSRISRGRRMLFERLSKLKAGAA